MLNLNVLQAMLACPYKAWQINKDFQQTIDNAPACTSNAMQDVIPIAAWYLEHSEVTPTPGETKKLLKHKKRADD
jgi:hypothetical protein